MKTANDYLIRTPQEKAQSAFYATGNHLRKVRSCQHILSELKRHQKQLQDIYFVYRMDENLMFGKETFERLNSDWNEVSDKYEDEIHNHLDSIELCNKWLNAMASHVQFTNEFFNGDEYELKGFLKALYREYGSEVGRMM